MTGLDESQMLTGLQVLVPNTEFESSVAEAGGGDGGNAGQAAAIPSFFYVKPLNYDWRFGLSFVAPVFEGLIRHSVVAIGRRAQSSGKRSPGTTARQ